MSPKLQMVNLKHGNIVKKAEDLVLARYELSELSIKLMSTLIAMVRVDDKEFAHRYVVRISDWKELSGLSGRSVYENLLKSAKELMSNPIHIQRGQSEKNFLVLNWLASYEYIESSGEIELEISSKLRPYLLELQGKFLEYGIENILPLRSAYVIRLYEILKHEFRTTTGYKPNQKKVVLEYTIAEFREMLSIPKSYQYSAHIKTRILDSAKKQFKEKTDISFTYNEDKRGKAVNKIEITVQENLKGSNDPLKDEKSFIAYCRKNIKELIRTEDGGYIKISEDGKLYNSKTLEAFDKEKAKRIWERCYDLAQKGELLSMKQGKLF